MRSIEAAALQRDISDSETDEIIDEVSSSTDNFLISLLEIVGSNRLSSEAIEELRESIHSEILTSAWAMVQAVTDEMSKHINGGKSIDTKTKRNEC